MNKCVLKRIHLLALLPAIWATASAQVIDFELLQLRDTSPAQKFLLTYDTPLTQRGLVANLDAKNIPQFTNQPRITPFENWRRPFRQLPHSWRSAEQSFYKGRLANRFIEPRSAFMQTAEMFDSPLPGCKRVFLSYTRPDHRVVMEFASILKDDGHSVTTYLNNDKRLVTSLENIGHAIQNSDYRFSIGTPNAPLTYGVQMEVNHMQHMNLIKMRNLKSNIDPSVFNTASKLNKVPTLTRTGTSLKKTSSAQKLFFRMLLP